MYAIVFVHYRVVAPCREWFEWALVRQEAPGRCSGSPGSCKHYNLDVDHRDSPLLSLHYTEQTTMPLQNFFFFAEETCAHIAAAPRLGVNTTESIGAPSSEDRFSVRSIHGQREAGGDFSPGNRINLPTFRVVIAQLTNALSDDAAKRTSNWRARRGCFLLPPAGLNVTNAVPSARQCISEVSKSLSIGF